ncbi:MAG TPA: nitroreductase family protein [Dehalococcoidia bacterium]|nr:nitroreductase family protein [Dehalococcoidia bacterium]
MNVSEAITSRRSLRRFDGRAVPEDTLRELVALACAAPAPHHTRPWRFVLVRPETRERLTAAMTEAWRRDLEADGETPRRIQELVSRSRKRLLEAPALLLAGLSLEGARAWPDQRRRAAERDMFVQSLGAALQNLSLAAWERGIGSCVLGSPLFCQPAVRQALTLPPQVEPLFLVMLGYPPSEYEPPQRAALRLEDFISER